MNKELKISLDDNVIRNAKKIANNHKESLSKMIEDYLKFVINNTNLNKKNQNLSKKLTLAPIVKDLLGSITISKNIDYDKVKYEYLREKYLND